MRALVDVIRFYGYEPGGFARWHLATMRRRFRRTDPRGYMRARCIPRGR